MTQAPFPECFCGRLTLPRRPCVFAVCFGGARRAGEAAGSSSARTRRTERRGSAGARPGSECPLPGRSRRLPPRAPGCSPPPPPLAPPLFFFFFNLFMFFSPASVPGWGRSPPGRRAARLCLSWERLLGSHPWGVWSSSAAVSGRAETERSDSQLNAPARSFPPTNMSFGRKVNLKPEKEGRTVMLEFWRALPPYEPISNLGSPLCGSKNVLFPSLGDRRD